MSFLIGPNFQPTTAYTAAGTLENLPPCVKVTMDVQNGSVFYQIKRLDGLSGAGGSWNPETFQVPGSKPITRQGITGVRVRANSVTTPATVCTVEVLLATEA